MDGINLLFRWWILGIGISGTLTVIGGITGWFAWQTFAIAIAVLGLGATAIVAGLFIYSEVIDPTKKAYMEWKDERKERNRTIKFKS